MANVTTIDSPSPSLVPGQAPSGTMLAAFEFTLNQSVTFVDWNELLSAVTIPSSVSTNGHTFDAYGYDLTLSVAEGYNLGTVSGTTISFGSGLGPVGLLANHTYLIVLMMQ